MTATPPPITIRPAQPSDFEAWHEDWKNYQAFYRVDLSPQTTQTTWQRFFDPAEPLHCAVASDGQRFLGFVHFVFHRSTWADTDFCYLEDLYVNPQARGQHIGKQLIEYVQQQARDTGCARLYWHTQESNHTAQRLYDWIADKPGVIEYRMSLKDTA